MSNYDGTHLKFKDNMEMNTFRYDSWRVPANIALDYQWACADGEWQQHLWRKDTKFLLQHKGLDTYSSTNTAPTVHCLPKKR
jgi:oligosaccharide reducing-end xylanase